MRQQRHGTAHRSDFSLRNESEIDKAKLRHSWLMNLETQKTMSGLRKQKPNGSFLVILRGRNGAFTLGTMMRDSHSSMTKSSRQFEIIQRSHLTKLQQILTTGALQQQFRHGSHRMTLTVCMLRGSYRCSQKCRCKSTLTLPSLFEIIGDLTPLGKSICG